jgi:hypothetical protein
VILPETERQKSIAAHQREWWAAEKLRQAENLALNRHAEEYDSSGGYRGILRGRNISCICGAHWVATDSRVPFACPNDTTSAAAAAAAFPATELRPPTEDR